MNKNSVMIFIMMMFVCAAADAATDLKSAFSQGKLAGEIRLFEFVRDFDASPTRQDIAAGGMIYYRTAPLSGFQLGLAFYTGQAMGINDEDKEVYGLLSEDGNNDHQSFSVLGESFIAGNFSAVTVKIGRQELETPFVNTDDNRLTPQSAEAYVLGITGIPDLAISAGFVTKMRGKTATEFVSMTEYAGFSGDGKSLMMAGLSYTGIDGLKLQMWDYFISDYFNEIYFRADGKLPLNDQWQLFGAAQYLVQKDAGDARGGSLDTYTYAAEAGFETGGLAVSGAFAKVGDDEVLIPWGHDLICSIMVNDGVRPEETSFLGAVQYDFAHIGVKGLVAKIKHLDFNTPDNGSNASPDKTETDLDIIFTPKKVLENASIRLRHAIVNKDEALGGEDYTDTRIMVKYQFEAN